MVQCLVVDGLIAISSANCQLLLDCIEKAWNCRKGNSPGLFLDSLLQCWNWSCLPSNFINSLFKHGDGALRHLPTCCFKVVFLEVGYAVNHHHYIRFLCVTIIPYICQYHCSGCYWLWMVLASAHYTNNTLTFLQQQGFFSKLHPQGCKPTMRCLAPAGRNWPTLKKAFYDGGWEATSYLALKQRIKKAQQIPVPTILINTVKVQQAVCAWNGYWADYR